MPHRPRSPESVVSTIAALTGTVTAELRGIPNEPLLFTGETKPRTEDAAIVYTWDKFLRGGDETWPLRLPMTKAAVRAMDTITAVAKEKGDTVDRCVVSGASKRGWTTWTTAVVDKRVIAIIPLVIDTLNVDKALPHHYEAYGSWSPALQDYTDMKIFDWYGTAQFKKLMAIEDPYSYLDRLTMPKYIVNSAGDQYFVPDSSQFYWNDLKGEKHLRYVPNTKHDLNGSDARETAGSFYAMIVNDEPRPEMAWSFEKDGSIHLKAATKPTQVVMWQATDPTARDFRLDTIGNRPTQARRSKTRATVSTSRKWISPPQAGPPSSSKPRSRRKLCRSNSPAASASRPTRATRKVHAPAQTMIWNNREAVSIENEEVRVVVLPGGGHIAAIEHKSSGVNPLWTPPWTSVDPVTFDPAKNPEFGTACDGRLLAGIMGHNLCLDIFGGPSAEEDAAGVTAHGEGSVAKFDITTSGQKLTMQADFPLAQIRFERIIELKGHTLNIRESAESQAAFDRPIGWTQHVTLGPPFLERGKTQFRSSAKESKVFESEFGTDAYLKPAAEFEWPLAPGKDGTWKDLRVMNLAEVSSGYTAQAMDESKDLAYFTALEPDLKNRHRLSMEAKRFPLAWHLGRKPKPHRQPLEQEIPDKRHGIRSLPIPRIPPRIGRSRRPLRHPHLSLAPRQIETGS